MDRSGNQCERQRHFHYSSAAPTVSIQPYNSTSTPSICGQSNQSLDTVRSLHQTVVSLRNALDDARREITNLKKQMNVQTVIEEGKVYKENDPDHREMGDSVKQSVDSGVHKMGSQIDVKIRVSSNLNVNSTTGEEDGSGIGEENNKSGANSSRSVVSIKVMSQENLNVSTQQPQVQDTDNGSSSNQSRNEEEEDTQPGPSDDEDEEHREAITERTEEEEHNDDKSVSDGENSVFDNSKGEVTGKSRELQVPHQKLNRAHSDTQEEVDDIELIFSSDADHKELIHEEEMVSISAIYEPWQKPGSSGSPVLLSFERLSLDDDRHLTQRQRKHTHSVGGGRSSTGAGNNIKLSLDEADEEQGVTKSNLGTSKWQRNAKELHVTDISKCGISEENIMDMSRRNTCPNPPMYRPLLNCQREFAAPSIRTRNSLSANRCILGTKFSRPSGRGGFLISSPARTSLRSPLIAITNAGNVAETGQQQKGPKRSSSVQTEISALPEHWQSESHLAGGCYGNGMFTLPSKFNPVLQAAGHCRRAPLRPSQKTQEARRVLLSDINFTSMIPELSRSADHLCPEDGDEMAEGQENHPQDGEDQEQDHNQMVLAFQQQQHQLGPGHHLRTPTMHSYRKCLTPSTSIQSHGSMNENSFGTQATQTGDYWIHKGDSFDSTSYYTNDSRLSLNKNCRSQSVPSIRCVYCKRSHGFTAMRTSESMHYTPRVGAIPESYGTVKGSLPDLRQNCCCPRRYQDHSLVRHQSSGSTESLLEDSADVFVGRSTQNVANVVDYSSMRIGSGPTGLTSKHSNIRRCSENDIGRSYTPSKQSLPFLPKSANCLKIGHLAKVIARNGRVVVGQVRYVGPICNAEYVAKLEGASHDTFIGLELPSNGGDTDGTVEGKRFFYCEQNHGIFVPFPKVIMAWTS